MAPRRGRVELRRIEDRTSRQVRFSKRRSGLFKKAYELSVLCDAEVALLVFSPAGKLYEFSSASSLEKTIDRYQKFMNAERDVDKLYDNVQKEVACLDADSKQLEIGKRFHKTNVANMNADDLGRLENDLSDALKWTRSRKTQLMMDSLNKLHKEETSLLEERRRLLEHAAGMMRRVGEAEADGGDGDGEGGSEMAAISSRHTVSGRPPSRAVQPGVDT